MKKIELKSKAIGEKRLSMFRVFLAVLIVIMLSYAIKLNLDKKNQIKAGVEEVDDYREWFAPYADVVSFPQYNFEQLGSTSTKDVILSFIVSSNTNECLPSWGIETTLDEASINLDLDRRIARLRQLGGRVAVSFGGAINTELAVSCKDNDKLYNAYNSVIERYGINTVDLDIEGQWLSDKESIKRRADVFAKLQKDYREKNKNLAIWLTLPVSPQGLTSEGTDVVAQMLSSGVDLAGVNVMTMDYGDSRQDNKSMLDASKEALIETHRQLGILYTQAGINLSVKSLWKKIGATPMIGQNDFVDEIFTLDDAKGLNEFAKNQGVGRISMWSANRDIPCGENYVDTKIVSDSCSGVKDAPFSFSQSLSKGFDGSFEQSAGILTISDPKSNVVLIDDPQKSPYQIWKESGAYPKGVKVVWHGNVYEAKWWTKNDLPDNPVLQAWQTPWRLIGPVMPDEKPIEQPTLPKGIYPKWNGETIYEGGDRVLFDGVPFQAKWWNQGESPAASSSNSDSSPWIPLTQSQIEALLKELKNKQ